MAKFKVGDKVKIVVSKRNCSCDTLDTEYLVITAVHDDSSSDDVGSYYYTSYDKDGRELRSCDNCLRDQHLDYYYSSNSSMNLIEAIRQSFLAEPEKSLQKVGIFDKDNMPTTEGLKVWAAYAIKNDKAFFSDVVTPILKVADEEKK